MSNPRRWLTAGAFVLLVLWPGVTSAQVALQPLTGPEIRAHLFGQRITGEYPSGQQWAEQLNSDGSTIYVENGVPVTGRMTLNGATLCFDYPGTEQSGGCFEVWKRGQNCFDFYGSGESVSLNDRRFGQSWSARGWVLGIEATCVTEQIS